MTFFNHKHAVYNANYIMTYKYILYVFYNGLNQSNITRVTGAADVFPCRYPYTTCNRASFCGSCYLRNRKLSERIQLTEMNAFFLKTFVTGVCVRYR